MLARSTTLIFLAIAAVGAVPASNRIVGGFNAKENQFPHQASIKVFGSHTCGGTILSDKFVLTAAHCTRYGDLLTTVGAGSTDVEEGIWRNIKTITNHKAHGNFQNDIAVLELTQPLVLSDSIQPIAWATQEIPEGAEVLISGWGKTETNGLLPSHLKYNILTKSSEADCKKVIGDVYFDGIICLNHSVNNGACNGDSGGPALYNNTLVGVANFVLDGCGTSYPDGYAKVSYFNDWIKENTGL